MKMTKKTVAQMRLRADRGGGIPMKSLLFATISNMKKIKRPNAKTVDQFQKK